MFEQLHPDTRDKLVKFPRPYLKLLIECGRRIVRAATLLGLVLTTVLTKRTEQYEGYKGCAKAKWIATLFGVHVSRVKTERAQWIDEGWFTREATTPRARKKFGQWVRLTLSPPSPPAEPVENPASPAPEVQPKNPCFGPEVQPLLNPSLSSCEEIYINQTLTPEAPKSGAYQPGHPTWDHIFLNDLHDDANSEALRQEAIQRGLLSNTESDQINFFAAIAHALRVAKSNACGLLRTIVEKGLWHFLSQADEYNGIARLRRSTEAQEARQACANPFLTTRASGTGRVSAQPIELSKDALVFQTLTVDLERAGVKGDLFGAVQQHGYLLDWDSERWLQAEHEVAQSRLLFARQQQTMATTRIEEIIEEDADERDTSVD